MVGVEKHWIMGLGVWIFEFVLKGKILFELDQTLTYLILVNKYFIIRIILL